MMIKSSTQTDKLWVHPFLITLLTGSFISIMIFIAVNFGCQTFYQEQLVCATMSLN